MSGAGPSCKGARVEREIVDLHKDRGRFPPPPDPKSRSPDDAVAALGASEIDQLGGKVFSEIKRQRRFAQAPILAELSASNSCEADDLVASGCVPVLDLCRALLRAGHDPKRALHAFRGGVRALVVRPTGEGAELADERHSTPRLRRRQERPKRYGREVATPARRAMWEPAQ
jgi:hypothetical protein